MSNLLLQFAIKIKQLIFTKNLFCKVSPALHTFMREILHTSAGRKDGLERVKSCVFSGQSAGKVIFCAGRVAALVFLRADGALPLKAGRSRMPAGLRGASKNVGK